MLKRLTKREGKLLADKLIKVISTYLFYSKILVGRWALGATVGETMA